MKTLMVYYSFTHNNEVLAQELQKQLGCDILKIEDLKKRNGFSIFLDILFSRRPAIKYSPVSLTAYDRFIFIAPIWAGKIATPLKTFLINERTKIKHYSFITICGGREGQRDKITLELSAALRAMPDAVTELWINNLLQEDQKNSIKYTSSYQLTSGDLVRFQNSIQEFIKRSGNLLTHKSSEQVVSWNS
ncbi:MAG TPA: hypothetical protein VIN08_06475 [Ohtaekwangia sp.]|uniref:flavodoxin family protein n=1 Tax=Ohtaekwangia sp. TaxID=2066019 RepID=UPI002F944979